MNGFGYAANGQDHASAEGKARAELMGDRSAVMLDGLSRTDHGSSLPHTSESQTLKVFIFGFELTIKGARASQVTLAGLFQHLKSLHDHEIEFRAANRLVYVNETETYYTGLLLTAKDHRKVCELITDGGRKKINLKEATQGSELIDFNFFVVHKATGRGLYQHYRGSCWVNKFGAFLGRQLEDMCARHISEEIRSRGGIAALSDEEQNQIENKYDGDLAFTVLVKQETFTHIVATMKKVSSFKFAFATINPEQERVFTPLRGVAQRVRHSVSFIREAAMQERIRSIMNFLKTNQVDEASVTGTLEDGLQRTILLESNPDSFGSYDYDDVADDMAIEPENFHTSGFMKKMLAVADSNPRLIGAAAK